MKVLAVITCLSSLMCISTKELPDCRVQTTPDFTLKYGDTFTIPEACLLIKCRGEQTFEIVSYCHTTLKPAPADVAAEKSKKMGDLILEGKACQANTALQF